MTNKLFIYLPPPPPLHVSHNTIRFTYKIWRKFCFQFPKGRLSVPGEEKEEKKGEPWIAAAWVLVALSLLFVLFLGGTAVKKFLSWSRERPLPDVIRMVLRKKINSPEMEPIVHADPQVENTTDASPEWNQQVCSAESTGACAVSEDLPLQVRQAKYILDSWFATK